MTLASLGGNALFNRDRHGKWPQIADDDRKAVVGVLDRGILSGSEAPEAKALQQEFASLHGVKHALLCHSGTSALQVAVGAIGVGEGDEVIVPAYSFIATALAVMQQGGIPVFVDVVEDTGNMDPTKLEAAISKRTKAIMPVHVHGFPADINAIKAICDRHGLHLLEDAAQAHLATYDGKPVGGFGKGAGFSMQSSKNFSAGEGGIYVTNDDALVERANQIRNFAQNIYKADASHYNLDRPLDGHRALVSTGIGSMYRGNEMMAAFARSQLKRLPGLTARARENARKLAQALVELPGVTPPRALPGSEPVYHKYRVWLDPKKAGVELSPKQLRDATLAALRAEGCEVVMWQSDPMPSFPLFREMRGFGNGFPFSASDTDRLRTNYHADYPASRALLDGSICLFSQTCPLIGQSSEVVDLYIEAFRKVWNERAKLVDVHRALAAGA